MIYDELNNKFLKFAAKYYVDTCAFHINLESVLRSYIKLIVNPATSGQ